MRMAQVEVEAGSAFAQAAIKTSRFAAMRMSSPTSRIEDCGSFLDEFACEIAEYNDYTRSVQHTHPETMQDDALHATNYALLLAVKTFSPSRRSIDECY